MADYSDKRGSIDINIDLTSNPSSDANKIVIIKDAETVRMMNVIRFLNTTNFSKSEDKL